jgi:hypothetical protein
VVPWSITQRAYEDICAGRVGLFGSLMKLLFLGWSRVRARWVATDLADATVMINAASVSGPRINNVKGPSWSFGERRSVFVSQCSLTVSPFKPLPSLPSLPPPPSSQLLSKCCLPVRPLSIGIFVGGIHAFDTCTYTCDWGWIGSRPEYFGEEKY